ncbi:MAG: hypothetical protein ACREEP_03360, partial [Dongiaceae bacterium]
MRGLQILIGTVVATSIFIQDVSAQPDCITDLEPNDTVESAQPLAGPFCLAGTFQQGDQDLILWTVSEAMSAKLWRIQLDGVKGQLTGLMILQLEPPAEVGALPT